MKLVFPQLGQIVEGEIRAGELALGDVVECLGRVAVTPAVRKVERLAVRIGENHRRGGR